MANCGQACPYNTLDGCKVKEYNAICPLTNMATPVTEYRMTNADRIRAMSDEELAEDYCKTILKVMQYYGIKNTGILEDAVRARLEWLKQPAEEGDGNG